MEKRSVYSPPMPRHLCVSLLLTIGLLFPSITFAQSPSSASGSGAIRTPEELHAELMKIRTEKTKGFRDKAVTLQKKEESYRKALATAFQKITELQSNCRTDFRHANRDQKFRVQLRCYRGEIALQKELLRKQHDFIAELPGISDTVRKNALQRIDALSDALAAVITGIDSGVFTSLNDLLEAKKNLFEKYRSPAWAMLTVLRAERLLSWTMLLLIDLEPLEEWQPSSGTGTVVGDPVASARSCLENLEGKLVLLLVPGSLNTSEQLKTLHMQAKACVPFVEALGKTMEGSGSAK